MTLIPAAETLAALDRIEADLAAIRRSLSVPQVDEADDSWPPLADDPSDADYVDTAAAAARACRSPDTIRTWAYEREIGRWFGGRWRISLRRLKKITG